MQRLRPGSLLKNNRYRIERDLGQGGFGITYLAFDIQAKRKVAIKEYFPKLNCHRDQQTQDVIPNTKDNASLIEIYKKKFVKEAETCRNLSHSNIVEIYDSFEEHQTAYFVMDYVDGESLEDILKEREIPGTHPKRSTPFSQYEAHSIIRFVGVALMYIHSRNICHLDVKPGNIMRRKSDGHIFLIDFGVAKQYYNKSLMGDTNTPVGVSPGYSPMEQYRTGGVQTFSPQSDVYSLAATLFKFLTGIRPPEPAEFFDRGLPIDELKSNGVSQHIIDAICQAMLTKDKRTQSVSQFIDQLNETSDDLTEVWVDPDDPQMQMQPEEPNTTWFYEQQKSAGKTTVLTYTPKRTNPKNFWSRIFGKKEEVQNVYSSVFAPSEIKLKSRMMVQVYLHLDEETGKVIALAAESDKKAERRDYIPLQTKLKKGDKVDVVLNINGDRLLYNSNKSIIWQGSFCKCAFDYLVPSDLDVGELGCSVNLSVNGALVGEMLFYTRIVDSPAQSNANVIAKPVKRLFISYSHNDLESVEKIAKLYEGMDVDVFFDKHRLKSGYIYSEEIFNFIRTADTFILCWSENAAQSEYVEKERKAALELAYPNFRPREDAQISIKPYNIQPYATPPKDMIEHYHFEEL